MATYTTDVSTPTASPKGRGSNDSLEAEAIGLEVPVRVHGSQVTSVLDATEHAEPFEEDTATMIVFPRGAVVKLRAHVRTGHAIVLTNLLSKAKTLGRVIQVNSAANHIHYVKLEFVEETPGFWGVHFPSDPLPSARNQQAVTSDMSAAPVTTAAEAAAAFPDSKLTTQVAAPRISSPPNSAPAPSSFSVPKPQPPDVASPVAAREISKNAPPKTSPPAAAKQDSAAPPQAPGYSAAPLVQDSNLEPVASASPATVISKPASRHSTEPKFSAPAVKPGAAKPAVDRSDVRAKHQKAPRSGTGIADSDRLPFSGQSSLKVAPTFSPTSPLEKSFGQPFSMRSESPETSTDAALEEASRSGSKWVFAIVVVCCLGLISAGGFMYRHPGFRLHWPKSWQASAVNSAKSAPSQNSTPSVSDTGAGNDATSALNPPATSAGAELAPAKAAETVSTSAAHDSVNVVPDASRLARPGETARTSKADSAKLSERDHAPAAASKNFGNLFAGDLNTKVQPTQRPTELQNAPLPQIQSDSADSGSEPSASSALGDLVGGGSATKLPAPPKPAPALRAGGKVVPPELLSSVAPTYPSIARANHVEGVVSIRAQLDKTGKITSAKVISGPMLLRNAALEALHRWKYAPAKLDGQPIATEYLVRIRFVLNNP